jgi:hypothetical protein
MICKCKVCGIECESIEHSFIQRQHPYNKPFWAPLYFSDMYFGGDGSEYCGPECSLKDYELKRKEKEEIETLALIVP